MSFGFIDLLQIQGLTLSKSFVLVADKEFTVANRNKDFVVGPREQDFKVQGRNKDFIVTNRNKDFTDRVN